MRSVFHILVCYRFFIKPSNYVHYLNRSKLATTNENITGIACRVGVIVEAEQCFVLDKLDVHDCIWLLH